MNRIFDFSEDSVILRARHHQMEIHWEDGRKMTTPFSELAVVLLSNKRISLTQSVLLELAKSGASLIVCDERFLPVGMFMPLVGHHLQSRCMKEQASASITLQKKVWKEIVCAKIRGQSQVLEEILGPSHSIAGFGKLVKSGDSTNIEARAARKYWQALFPKGTFIRDPDGVDSLNIGLNYGYAVLRGIVARAVTAAGLNVSLGVFHHNKYNPFCLADDLMEPLRPVVDRVIYRLHLEDALQNGLTSEVKRRLISSLLQRFLLQGCQETLFETACQLASSLVDVFGKRRGSLKLPERLPMEGHA